MKTQILDTQKKSLEAHYLPRKHLLSIASTERGWRKRPEAVRKIAPELLLQKRRSMLTRVQNDLDLDRAKERASKRRQKGVKSESTGSVKP